MPQDSLTQAKRMMKRRKFSKAILLLESREENYNENFEYYLQLGICYLYTGNYGSASSNFQKARRIRMTDVELLLGQAVLFLRRGDTEKAIQYYMEILELDPQNKTASSAMEFIRRDGDYSTICRWVDTGRIEQFFPQVGVSPYKVFGVVIPVLAAVLGVLIVVLFSPKMGSDRLYDSGGRGEIPGSALSLDDRKNLVERDISSSIYKYKMTAEEIQESYEKALEYYNQERDNKVQIEINRLLNSNASVAIKHKVRDWMQYLSKPDLNGLMDNPKYSEVIMEPDLYLDCWVQWGGRISNLQKFDNSMRCDFIICDEKFEHHEGTIPLVFDEVFEIENGKYTEVLAQIFSDGGRLSLKRYQHYQSIKDSLITTEKK